MLKGHTIDPELSGSAGLTAEIVENNEDPSGNNTLVQEGVVVSITRQLDSAFSAFTYKLYHHAERNPYVLALRPETVSDLVNDFFKLCIDAIDINRQQVHNTDSAHSRALLSQIQYYHARADELSKVGTLMHPTNRAKMTDPLVEKHPLVNLFVYATKQALKSRQEVMAEGFDKEQFLRLVNRIRQLEAQVDKSLTERDLLVPYQVLTLVLLRKYRNLIGQCFLPEIIGDEHVMASFFDNITPDPRVITYGDLAQLLSDAEAASKGEIEASFQERINHFISAASRILAGNQLDEEKAALPLNRKEAMQVFAATPPGAAYEAPSGQIAPCRLVSNLFGQVKTFTPQLRHYRSILENQESDESVKPEALPIDPIHPVVENADACPGRGQSSTESKRRFANWEDQKRRPASAKTFHGLSALLKRV